MIDLQIGPVTSTKRFTLKAVRTVTSLSLPPKTFTMDDERWGHLKQLPLPEYRDARPQLLIGLDNLRLAVPLKTREGLAGEPVAVKTRLGWCVYGKTAGSQIGRVLHMCKCGASDENSTIQGALRKFYELEYLGTVSSDVPDPDKRRALTILETTTVRIVSNNPVVLDRLGGESSSPGMKSLTSTGDDGERVLGLRWNPSSDQLSFYTEACLGMAEIWDEAISPSQMRDWPQLRIPRCYFPKAREKVYENAELHLFVDASQLAYACVLYLRVVDSEGEPHCTMLCRKAKVAPLKPLTIPKMELQACMLGARLLKSTEQHHPIAIKKRVLWTDSTVALSWIHADPRNYRPFVANRVAEIQENTNVNEWRWVPTQDNPADEANKWKGSANFNWDGIWFQGPSFLLQDEEFWPTRRLVSTTPEEEIWRGRIGAAPELPYAAMYPIVLPRDAWITHLLVDKFHRRFRHANNETVVNELRQYFQIPKMRRLVSKVVRQCVFCHIRRTLPQIPPMAPLPKARRGAPVEVFSDNGTNFVGASQQLRKEIDERNDALAATFTNANTRWTFNPPGAPHMEGVWERMVRSMKATMSTMTELQRTPDDETLVTVIVEAEVMINTCPLTYIPLESADQESLTPNHFLRGSSSGVKQRPVAPTSLQTELRSNWKMVQHILDEFWRRWIKEYLPVLARQSKWFEAVREIEVGDMVLIVDGG
uniref:Integrase catalytic domain-containing protein n=1 Tax=Anopheles arabiensis TaxID=7173 RepID=A0A182HXY9_ANOAR